MVSSLRAYLSESWDELKKDRSSRYTAYVLLIVGLSAAGWFGWHLHVQRREAAALQAFSSVYALYQEALQSTQPDWPSVTNACATEYTAHRGSNLAPFFMAFQADALVHEGKNGQAIDILRKALALMKKDGSYYYAYATKLALLLQAAGSAEYTDEGTALLEQLAADNKNPVRDAALYYLGHAAWWHNNVEVPAQWQNLRDNFGAHSLWAQLVHHHLSIPLRS
jgi:tetratricopeptide (TPR) repeat protein